MKNLFSTFSSIIAAPHIYPKTKPDSFLFVHYYYHYWCL